jgi:hypothetical protein
MKYLRLFENDYTKDDYVLMSGKQLVGQEDQFVKVVKKDGNIFQVKFDDDTITSVHKNSIIRLLNKDEIQDYNIKIAMKKYNI